MLLLHQCKTALHTLTPTRTRAHIVHTCALDLIDFPRSLSKQIQYHMIACVCHNKMQLRSTHANDARTHVQHGCVTCFANCQLLNAFHTPYRRCFTDRTEQYVGGAYDDMTVRRTGTHTHARRNTIQYTYIYMDVWYV